MRIGLIADIHANLEAFKAVMKDMPRVDEIVCIGDLVGYCAQPNEVVQLARSKEVRTVMGNHDYAAVTRDVEGFNPRAAEAAIWTSKVLTKENSQYLASLPTHLELKISEQKLLLVHGSPRDPLHEYVFPDLSNRDMLDVIEGVNSDWVALGHTHIPMKRTIMGKTVVNPGAVGQPRDRDPRAAYAVLAGGREIDISFRRIEYDVKETASKMKAVGLPEELADRLFFGW